MDDALAIFASLLRAIWSDKLSERGDGKGGKTLMKREEKGRETSTKGVYARA
jgi:hypothetical protein